MPREKFHQDLRTLQEAVMRFGALVEQQYHLAIQALQNTDLRLAAAVSQDDARANRAYAELERETVALLALQAPAAGDLRAVLAALAIATELERIADHAADIGKLVARAAQTTHVEPSAPLWKLAEGARQMLHKSLLSAAQRDVAVARELAADDEEVDEIQEEVFRFLIDHPAANPPAAERALYLALAAHHIERVADRATNIGEQVVYAVSGVLEELNPPVQEEVRCLQCGVKLHSHADFLRHLDEQHPIGDALDNLQILADEEGREPFPASAFKKILLTLDGSELARRAIPYVSQIAQEQSSAVYVLSVIDPPDVIRHELGDGPDGGEMLEARVSELHDLQSEEATSDLAAARDELDAVGVRDVTTLIREGAPAETIIRTAIELDCDAIAMGARGHSGMTRESIGSVAEAVVLNAPGIAVLLVGPRRALTHGPTVFGMRTISPAPAESNPSDSTSAPDTDRR